MPIAKVRAGDIVAGDTVQISDHPSPSVVRSVHVILHLSNNTDIVVPVDDQLAVIQ